MVNYINGKIYRIVCNITGKQYIGSTVSPLATRLAQHKKLFKDGKSGTSKLVLENDDFAIFLIERFSCDTKEEMLARERYYIETLDCVNKKIPLRTQAEWYKDNREQIIPRQTLWNNANREKCIEYQKRFKNKHTVIDLTNVDLNIDNDEQVKLVIEDIYESTELVSEDDIYEYIESKFNIKE